MLLGQQGGGGQHAHLSPAARRSKHGAQGHFGLAEADIATDHPVHGPFGQQVGQHGVDGLLLVGRGLEGKAVAEALIVGLVERQGLAALGLATGLDLQQLRGHVVRLRLCLVARLFPFVGAQVVQRGA